MRDVGDVLDRIEIQVLHVLKILEFLKPGVAHER